MKAAFTTQQRWDDSYAEVPLEAAAPGDPVRLWLERHIPHRVGTALELGCFPGRYLAVLGELGYEVNGMDLTPRITELPAWFQQMGRRTGSFTQADVFTHPVSRRFDVVCSFGLIEHFGDWSGLLRRHAGLVEEGGLLAVSTPNFRGAVQQSLHRWLDRENLAEHNLEAMVPSAWADVVVPLGFEILQCGWLGPFDFWTGPGRRSRLQRATVKVIRRAVPLLRWLPEDAGAYAPYCALVARRRA
jgi:2-polyprenyl-3-methyl-5-hydroxy-6-metoxy-1,4-benzoquinol methylase